MDSSMDSSRNICWKHSAGPVTQAPVFSIVINMFPSREKEIWLLTLKIEILWLSSAMYSKIYSFEIENIAFF